MKEFICITCTEPTREIYRRTYGNFIKLQECVSCGTDVDPYVECEKSIVLMDLVMNKIAVYRHILFNAENFSAQFYMKLAVALVLSEGYIRWISLTETKAFIGGIKNNEYYLYILCILAAIEFGVFGFIIKIYSLLKRSDRLRSSVYQATLLGQSGKLANIAAIVWETSTNIAFQVLLAIFILISSIQSIRAALQIGHLESSFIVVLALACSVFASHSMQFVLLGDKLLRINTIFPEFYNFKHLFEESSLFDWIY